MNFSLLTAVLTAAANPVEPVAAPLEQSASRAISKVEDRLPDNWRWLVEYSIAGNPVWRIVALFASILLALVLGRLLRMGLRLLSRRAESHGRRLLAVGLASVAQSTGFFAFVFGLQVGIEFLVLNSRVDAVAETTVGVLFAVAVTFAAYCLVAVVEEWLRSLSRGQHSKLDEMLVPLVSASLRVTVAVLGLVQVATILSDKPVTSVIAGLGVGGLAVGLAAQDTIKNFFGSLMIFSDRPFELGEEIRIDNIGGTIESVGFRSTRFRTVDGYLVTIPNGELANKTIVNISRRRNLPRQFTLPLSYDLPPEKIERAVAIVNELLADHEGCQPSNPPRVFLNELASSAVNLSVQYWYHPPDWWSFVAFNQRTNVEILKRFAAEGVRLAYPTQTVVVRPPAAYDATPVATEGAAPAAVEKPPGK